MRLSALTDPRTRRTGRRPCHRPDVRARRRLGRRSRPPPLTAGADPQVSSSACALRRSGSSSRAARARRRRRSGRCRSCRGCRCPARGRAAAGRFKRPSIRGAGRRSWVAASLLVRRCAVTARTGDDEIGGASAEAPGPPHRRRRRPGRSGRGHHRALPPHQVRPACSGRAPQDAPARHARQIGSPERKALRTRIRPSCHRRGSCVVSEVTRRKEQS